MFAQFPSPHFCTAAISSISSASDHGFLFLRGGMLPLAGPFASNTSAGIAAGRACFGTATGTVMFVLCTEQVASEFSEGALDDRPLGIFIVNGASTIELVGRLDSLGKPEAIST